ncbi:hypothetical protein Tco_0122870 [Tanacetum coccineum]
MTSPDYIYPIIVLSDSNVRMHFPLQHSPDYKPPLHPFLPFTKILNEVMQAYNATNNESPIPLPQVPITPPTVLPSSPVLPLSPMIDPQYFFLLEEILPSQKRAHSGFQKEQISHDDEIVLPHVRTSTLEILIEDIQIRHQSDMKILMDKIHKLKNHKGGPPDY